MAFFLHESLMREGAYHEKSVKKLHAAGNMLVFSYHR